MIKQKPVYVCDYCGNEMDNPQIKTHDVAYEGSSSIENTYNNKILYIDDNDFCSMNCFLNYIRQVLE